SGLARPSAMPRRVPRPPPHRPRACRLGGGVAANRLWGTQAAVTVLIGPCVRSPPVAGSVPRPASSGFRAARARRLASMISAPARPGPYGRASRLSLLTRLRRSRTPSEGGSSPPVPTGATADSRPAPEDPAAHQGNGGADPGGVAGRREEAPADEVPARRRGGGTVVTILACLPVMFALAAPVEATALTPAAFLRIPVEAVLGAAVLLVLPSRARRTAATGEIGRAHD